jgi:hypothetical protein
MIAALYIDPEGPYPNIPGVECWDELRDARSYTGPYPVVAHPPCHLWVNFAALNFKRYGGEHNRPGNDGGKFAHALATVRRVGGVLEHPAGSKAWSTFGLCPPPPLGETGWCECIRLDGSREWVCEVWQSAYGHKARKRTWLLYVGNTPPLAANWKREPGTHQCGWFDRNKPTLGKREASLTPVAFAEYLVALARHSAAQQVAA